MVYPGKNIKKLTKYLLLQGKIKISKKALSLLTKFCIQATRCIIKKTNSSRENAHRDIMKKKKSTRSANQQTISDKYTEEIKEEKKKLQIEKKKMKNIIFCKKNLLM